MKAYSHTRARGLIAPGCLGIAIWLSLHAPDAFADCVTDANGNVSCSGSSPSFNASGNAQLTVTIQPNASFNGNFIISNVGVLSVNNGDASTLGGNLQSVALAGIANGVFLNNGNINGTFTITGQGNNVFINYAVNGRFNGPIQIEDNGNNTIINQGTLNPLLQISGTGLTTITNSGSMNGGINATNNGTTYLTNTGTIQNGSIQLGSGNDVVVNAGSGVINSSIDQGAGDDAFYMRGGTVGRDIHQGEGNDWFSLTDGQINGGIYADNGNDYLIWTAGLVNSINMGAGDDRADFQNLTDTQLRTITIDGGPGNDSLYWYNTQGSRPDRLLNWEQIQLLSNSQLTMGPTLRSAMRKAAPAPLASTPPARCCRAPGNSRSCRRSVPIW